MHEKTQKLIEQIKKEKDVFVKAKLLLAIKKEGDLKLADLAKELELTPSNISHLIRLNKLPALVIDGFYSDLVSLTHLFIIARLYTEEDMVLAYERVLAENLTVFQTDELLREMLYKVKSEGRHIVSSEKRNFTMQMKKHGFDAKVVQSRTAARLIVTAYGNLKETTEKLRQMIEKLTSD